MSEPTLSVFGGVRTSELTVKEYAHQERVTERTVWRWIHEKRAIPIRRTPGGGVRVLVTLSDNR